jgi:DNA-binding MarR family transcriptional regulator
MRENVNKLIGKYIKMIERIANGKTNILDFGDDLIFYRGEIHMIKMIGDFPGIYISEMARKFNVTRAVVSKTIIKLEKKEIVIKEKDPLDKKKIRLSLSKKGRVAYIKHQNYHNDCDNLLFDYLNELDSKEIEIIDEFLEKANEQIERHF